MDSLVLLLPILLVLAPILFLAGFTGCNAHLGAPLPFHPPDPSDFTATAAGGNIQLTWKDNSTNATHFKIIRRDGVQTITIEDLPAKPGMPPIPNDYTDSIGIKPATTYEYELYAVAVNLDSTGLVLAHATTPA